MTVHAFTLYDLLVRNAVAFADRPAVIDAHSLISFRALLERVDALAYGLSRLQLARGERLTILAHNHLEYLDLYGACAKLGIIAYPINWRLTPEEIRRVVDRAQPRMMVIDEATVALVSGWSQSASTIPYWYTMGNTPVDQIMPFGLLYEHNRTTEAAPASQPDDAFAVISTAAVDIVPRGAILSHTNMLMANLQTIAMMGLKEVDSNLLALPLFHVAALNAAFATLHAGGANVLMPRFDAAQAVQLIDRHQVTYLTSFPPVLMHILDAAQQAGSTLPSLRHVAGLDGAEAIQRLHTTTRAHFWSGFGQTETSGFVTLQRVADHPGSAGKVGPLCQVKIVDDYDREVPVGTAGEIVVQGPVVFQGYYDQPDVTAYTFRNGWHHTGDVGRFDAEGYLYYVRRKPEKELIKPGGENVYPAEVETVIMEIPQVTGVCVFGVPDVQWGEAIKAVVATSNTALTAERVIDYVGSRIARYKRPKWVEFTETLPTTAEGTIDREAVKATWGAAS